MSGRAFLVVLTAVLAQSCRPVDSAVRFNGSGLCQDRTKIFIRWKDECDTNVAVNEGAAGTSGLEIVQNIVGIINETNPILADAVASAMENLSQLANQNKRLLAPRPSSPEQRIAEHRRRRLKSSTREAIVADEAYMAEGPRRRLQEMSLEQRRDVVMSQLDVLAAVRASERIPLRAMATAGPTTTPTSRQVASLSLGGSSSSGPMLSTGLDFDAPIYNGDDEEDDRGGDLDVKTVVTADDQLKTWHSSASLKKCPLYNNASTFTDEMHLVSSFLEKVKQDIIDVPCGMTGEEIVSLAKAMPCVDFTHINVIRKPLEVNPKYIETELLQFQQLEEKRRRDSQALETECVGCVTPNDLDDAQWFLLDNLPGSVHPQRAWSEHTGNRDKIVVAVLDTGSSWHSDLRQNIWANEGEGGGMCADGQDNDGNGFIDDCHGWDFANGDNDPYHEEAGNVHGTPVSGVIAARGHNGYGMTGVCPFCQVVPLKIGNADGLSTAHEVSALDYIIRMKIRISNNSFGGYSGIAAEYAAIQATQAVDHVFVTAAGNDGCDIDGTTRCSLGEDAIFDPMYQIFAPCGYTLDNVICVGSTSQSTSRSSFSNYGSRSVDFFAPGSFIWAPANPDVSAYDFGYVSGTSFASPITAGAIGLKMGRNPELDARGLREALRQTARNYTSLDGHAVVGGIVDVNAFIRQQADSSGLSPDRTWPEATVAPGHGQPDYLGSSLKLTPHSSFVALLVAAHLSAFLFVFV